MADLHTLNGERGSNSSIGLVPQLGDAEDAARIIESRIASLVPVAEAQGYDFLSFLLKMALLESNGLGNDEPDSAGTTRCAKHNP